MTDNETENDGISREEDRLIGKKATVRVSILMEYHVDVEMPIDGDPGDQADFELFAQERFDDYDEKDVVNARVLDEEPIYASERDEEGWPSYV